MKNCIRCDCKLSGRQTKFCSIKCKNRYGGSYQGPYAKNRDARAMPRKLQLLNMNGGCCVQCGYRKNLSAICFHHIDRRTKKFLLDLRGIGNRSWTNVVSEMRKCIPLCMNCHTEIHHPNFKMDP